ncbi:septum site-determining protein MinC [Paenibacillus darwinianus]|uniref:Probable septum site-determining protein MinC n=1 Tax=Paenibacillus darwinianus TaxID=1380763 RepID=A0A9W5W631_9BACL|nr:septum site-determining protein MinC [Paenibacillus darwinianus]EXX85136.1 septum site-determining protein MinC [Paenibacillus darwinianus]EXX90081.1 septum site-determining protein MinC [Paenibacillus darwinianus]EXX91355.1 septum site-determining protein MinC [Paenibacillus darwinianus]
MTEKQHITIKGVKEGLVFLLDDKCEFSQLLDELHYKLDTSHQQLLTGPLVHVHVKLGQRQASEEQKEQIVNTIRKRGNLLVQSVEAEPAVGEAAAKDELKMLTGIIRSGQTIEHTGHLLLMGDLNPGGTLLCTGDIYVLGSLRGMAHAGIGGRTDVIIAASQLKPTQLRIADVISRPPDEWITGDTLMEFAFLQDGQMKIDKLSGLFRIRRDPIVFKGV